MPVVEILLILIWGRWRDYNIKNTTFCRIALVTNVALIKHTYTFLYRASCHGFSYCYRFSDSGAGTDTRPESSEFTTGFQWGSYYAIFSFICMFSRSLIVLFVLFLLVGVFSVLLRYMDYDYPFGLQTFLDITILTELSHFLHL